MAKENIEKLKADRAALIEFAQYINLKTAVEDSLSAQVLCLQAVTDTAVVTKLVKCEAVATSMDSSACGRPPRSTAVFRIKDWARFNDHGIKIKALAVLNAAGEGQTE
jgi:hypothetical protein